MVAGFVSTINMRTDAPEWLNGLGDEGFIGLVLCQDRLGRPTVKRGDTLKPHIVSELRRAIRRVGKRRVETMHEEEDVLSRRFAERLCERLLELLDVVRRRLLDHNILEAVRDERPLEDAGRIHLARDMMWRD